MKELEINTVDYSEEEIWLPVVGYEGLYEVSSKGRVKSIYRKERLRHWNGKTYYYRIRNGRLLAKRSDIDGYSRTPLHGNGKVKNFKVSRLVALTFIPNPDNKPEVNHINGIKTDDSIENLEWLTGRENIIHAIKTGLHSVSVCTTFTNEQVKELRKITKKNYKEESEKLEVPIRVYTNMINYKTYKYIE